MSKTKIVGYLMILIAALETVVDALNGGGFNLQGHFDAIIAALAGAGLIFLRSGVDKAAAK